MNETGATWAGGAVPDLILYSRPGCALCDEAREVLEALLAQRREAGRPTPAFVERDIESNPEWEEAHFATIPVVELGDLRLELAMSTARIGHCSYPSTWPSPSAEHLFPMILVLASLASGGGPGATPAAASSGVDLTIAVAIGPACSASSRLACCRSCRPTSAS